MGVERGSEEEEDVEVSLELSIGGSYGKSTETEREKKQRDPLQTNVPRSDFSCNNDSYYKRDLEKKRKVDDKGKDEISEGQQIQKGGSIAGSGEIYSNSPDSRLNQCSSSRISAIKRLREDSSKSQAQPSKPVVHSNTPSVVTPSALLTRPPKPPNHPAQVAPVQQMPCVTTTGNGPHGKTITGFLCKYTKTEVSILCVCHRRFFSPSEFVEHAGGVDIVNPLRHITIVNPIKRTLFS